jgi:hypothetical protein
VKLQQRDPELTAADTEVECKSASHHHSEIAGEVNLLVKIEGFSWKFSFFIAKDLARGLIFGTDFIGKTGLVFNIFKHEFHFHFASGARLKLSCAGSSEFEDQGIQNIDSTPDTHKTEFAADHLTVSERI